MNISCISIWKASGLFPECFEIGTKFIFVTFFFCVSVLICWGCYDSPNTIDWVAYKQQKFISYSSGG